MADRTPHPVRPAVTFQGYISTATEVAVLTRCYTDQGVPNYPDYPVGAKKGDKPESRVRRVARSD